MTNPSTPIKFHLGGFVTDYVRNVTDQWLLVAPDANPAILEMFRDQDRQPQRDMTPWHGEFAGKYLTSAAEVYRLTGDPRLLAYIRAFVEQLIACQDADGYLGPWPRANRLSAHAPNGGGGTLATWDVWGHYHAILGLLRWHEVADAPNAVDAASRIGDMLCDRFLGASGGILAECVDGNVEMNQAIIHGLAVLTDVTGNTRYRKLALQIVDEFGGLTADGKPAGDYLHAPLAGKEFFETPRPRWESLHAVIGLAELYRQTRNEKFRQAVEKVWWSIAKLDRHNNGGFSSGERAKGNPYAEGAIETCCTIAWIALSVEVLRLTGDSIVADELELSTLNSVTGMHSASGRWVTYNTPMDGVRKAAITDIVFQAREGSPELNCCSVNGARGFGLIADWAASCAHNAITLNWYGPSTFGLTLPSGVKVAIHQVTDYPKSGSITIKVEPTSTTEFELALRIPHWSRITKVTVNGQPIDHVTAGSYCSLVREWLPSDIVQIELDMTLRYWVGERECAGKVSVYRGPILLAYDRRYNKHDPDAIPELDVATVVAKEAVAPNYLPPFLLLELSDSTGHKVRVCDFGSAGDAGTPYRSWLPIFGAQGAPYSPSNPSRTAQAVSTESNISAL